MNQQQLIEENMKLVYFIISREYPTYIGDEDISQSGMLGLCKAANHWNGEGLFSTYAGKCIRNEIRQEFIRRKKHANVISLDVNVGEDITLGDVVIGEDNISYIDQDGFYTTLNNEERDVLKLDSLGYSPDEIAELRGWDIQKSWKILRMIQLKRRKFDEN